MCIRVIFNLRSDSHYGHFERKREHPASLSLSSVISIDRSSNDLSSTQSSYKSAPRQPKQPHHLLRTSAPLTMVAASPSPLGGGSNWNCQPHPISAVDGHTGQLPPAIPTINDPAADGWSRENFRAIAWLAHRLVPLFPIKYLVPPTYLPAVIIIAANKSFSIPSDMDEISNNTLRLQCFRRRIIETTIIQSILFNHMTNNSPQRTRKRSFKYMVY